MGLRDLFPELLREWEYTYITGWIREQENSLLNPELLQQLIESPTLESTWNLLEDTVFSPIKDSIPEPYNIESALNLLLAETYSSIKSLTPISRITDWLTLKYDFYNLKVGMKTKYFRKDSDSTFSCIGMINPDKLLIALEKKQYPEIPKIYADTIQQVLEEFRKSEDPQCIDLVLDKAMFSLLRQNTVEESDFVRQYFLILTDLYNLLSFFRVKTQEKGISFLQRVLSPGGSIKQETYLELYPLPLSSIKTRLARSYYGNLVAKGIKSYQETGSLGDLEKLADDFVLDFVRVGKVIPLGPEAIIGYIVAKENDIKNIRIIWQGKYFGLPHDKIKESLRKTYV
jgi:V/A-type H+-transporting ATPase subunit C